MRLPEFVVVDGHDGYTIFHDADAADFTAESATEFAALRNSEMKPEQRLWAVCRVTPVISPATDPERFTDQEADIFHEGRCCWQTGYGLPWTTYCGKKSKPGADFGHCAEHDGEA
jgi:hypothetical protein